jgi:hypothetical protein
MEVETHYTYAKAELQGSVQTHRLPIDYTQTQRKPGLTGHRPASDQGCNDEYFSV